MADKNNKNKRDPDVTLSLPEQFYIQQHGNLSIEELAKVLGKPIKIVKEYCQAWLKDNPPKVEKRARKLMSRPAKRGGVVAMTEAASMVGDETRGHYVTIEAINKAMADENHELVKELKERYEKQQQENRGILRNQYSDVIHYIDPPAADSELY